MNSQKFIRFTNRTVFFRPIEWPDDSDLSPQAAELRKFITDNNIGNAPVQFVLYQAGQKKVKLKVTIFSPSKITALVKQITNELPKFDYTGNWLSDFQQASSVAMQMKRELLVAFVSMEGSDWSKKIDEEIFKHPDFREYAGKYLVLCRIDFPPKDSKKPLTPEVLQQYNALASRYGVRGYPTVILLNDGGQQIGNAKYQKGGPKAFLQDVDELRRKDYERRTLMSDTVEIID
jgi:thioredoxin-related protein